MKNYLSYRFIDDSNFISTFDEAPLWSAAFGLLLLKHLEVKRNITVIDIASGAGFPLMELAGRLGNSCKLYGIDPWANANERARQKIKNYGLEHVEIIERSAAQLPFEDNTVDLIVSNLGINNLQDPGIVFKECYRVLKPAGKLALTTNLNGHWKEFYSIFYATLKQISKEDLIPVIQQDEEHRGTVETASQLFTDSGLRITRHFEDTLDMKFADGSAFLNHHFVKPGWLTTWMNILPENEQPEIFTALEANLNTYAERNGGLHLTVPMAYIEGIKE